MIASSIMSAFVGTELPPEVAARLAGDHVAGFTLFRGHNVVNASQVKALTGALQAAAPAGAKPLLIAADQEGGQLIGMGDDTTAFAGAMALGAAGDEDLAERVALAMGRELRAMGVNLFTLPALTGDIQFQGRLPVPLGDLYRRGHGVVQ